MIVHVFHRKDMHQDLAETTPDDLVWAAAVVVETVGEVFQKTNSINHHWSHNEFVIGAKTRSTSVGDIYITDDGRAYQVNPIGLEQIEPPQLPFAHKTAPDPIYKDSIFIIEGWLKEWSSGQIDRETWIDKHMRNAREMADGLHAYTGIFKRSYFFCMIAVNSSLHKIEAVMNYRDGKKL